MQMNKTIFYHKKQLKKQLKIDFEALQTKKTTVQLIR